MDKPGKTITIAFTGNEAIKEQLNQWAKQDDRSISAVIRKALKAEAQRRKRQTAKKR